MTGVRPRYQARACGQQLQEERGRSHRPLRGADLGVRSLARQRGLLIGWRASTEPPDHPPRWTRWSAGRTQGWAGLQVSATGHGHRGGRAGNNENVPQKRSDSRFWRPEVVDPGVDGGWLLRRLGEKLIQASDQRLGGRWHLRRSPACSDGSASSSQGAPPTPCVSASGSLSLRTPVTANQRPSLLRHDLVFTNSILSNPYFRIRSHARRWGCRHTRAGFEWVQFNP